MPAALWKMALGSLAWAVNAPAKPMPRAPCSKIAKPAACAGTGPRDAGRERRGQGSGGFGHQDASSSDLIGGSARRRSVRARLSEAGLRAGTKVSDRKRRASRSVNEISGAVSEVRRRGGRRASRARRPGEGRSGRTLPSRGRGAWPGRGDRGRSPASRAAGPSAERLPVWARASIRKSRLTSPSRPLRRTGLRSHRSESCVPRQGRR